MKKQIIAALFAATAVFAANIASAATITANYTFDLTAADYASSTQFNLSSDIFSSSTLIHVGDTIDLTYNFLPTQGLRLAGGSPMTFSAGMFQENSGASPFTIGNVSFNLIGNTTSFSGLTNGANQSSGGGHIGAAFTSNAVGAGQSVVFSGVHATFNVLALQGGQNTYDQAFLQVRASDIAVTAVPEPETYAMMVAGLGLLAFMQRRKSAKKEIA